MVADRGVEPRSPDFQTGALPLSESAEFPRVDSNHDDELQRLASYRWTTGKWFTGEESNLEPPASEAGVLPIELPVIVKWVEAAESNRCLRRHRPACCHCTSFHMLMFVVMVGPTRFERATSWSRTRRSANLRYDP
jgi:hypothetical protein